MKQYESLNMAGGDEAQIEGMPLVPISADALNEQSVNEANAVLPTLDIVMPFGVGLAQEITIEGNRASPDKTRYHSSTGRDGRNVWDWAVGQ